MQINDRAEASDGHGGAGQPYVALREPRAHILSAPSRQIPASRAELRWASPDLKKD